MNPETNPQQMAAMREKLWTERDVAEKLDALRRELVSVYSRLQEQAACIEKLMQHRHFPEGQLAMPLVENYNRPLGYRSQVPTALRDKE